MLIDYKLFKKDLETADNVCMFGVGTLLKDCFPQLVQMLGREPDCFSDNASDKWNQQFWGIPCISPDKLASMNGKTLVLVTVRNYEAIYAQLKELGLKTLYVVCFGRGYHRVEAIRTPSMTLSAVSAISLQGKWVMITGALRGIGRQIALNMAKRGANLVVHGRSEQQAARFVEECRSYGIEAVPLGAELSCLDEVDGMLESIDRLVPRVDIVFNNAGISPPCLTTHWEVSPRVYQEVFSVNAIAPIRICNHLLPSMIERGFGRVVNISSSIQHRPAEMAYACSKAALDKYVFDIAPSLTNTGVMISSVDPGWLRTDMGGESAPHPIESVLPGALLGALLDRDINGCWFTAQDYAGLSLEDAMQKAFFLHPELETAS